EEDYVDEKQRARGEHLRVAREEHRPVHPRRWIRRAERVAARVQEMSLVAGLAQRARVGVEDLTDGAARAQGFLASLERLRARLEHLPLTRVDGAGHRYVHQRRVIM